ncbi:hypothetical protein C0991_012535 [Blastosporella zonata]|nr:hypothetical protein C0991_012535 [Blastosporella zonata]
MAEIRSQGGQPFYDPKSYKDVQVLADEIGSYEHNYRYDPGTAGAKLLLLKTDPATMHIVTSLYAVSSLFQPLSHNFIKYGRTRLEARVFFDRPQTKAMLFGSLPVNESHKDLTRYINHSIDVPNLLQEFDNLSNMMSNIYAKQERQKTPPGRCDDIVHLWESYLKSIGAPSHSSGSDVILNEQPFYTMANAPSGAPINETDVLTALPAFADRHAPTNMEQLLRRESSLLDINATTTAPHAYSINSAASVYSCSSCPEARCLIGWNMTVLHHSREDMGCFASLFEDHPFRVSEAGCVAAMSILGLLGRDPQVTLAEDMDSEDPHIMCMNCSEESRQVLSWREGVSESSCPCVGYT